MSFFIPLMGYGLCIHFEIQKRPLTSDRTEYPYDRVK